MENRELNHKILTNVRSKIVVSNLESEESMKINKRKQIVSICAVAVIMLSGSFFTVNAATDGKLVESVKEKYEEIIFVKLDKDNYKITTQEGKNGDEEVVYTVKVTEDGNEEYKMEVDKSILEKENMQVVIEEGEEGPEVTFQDYESK